MSAEASSLPEVCEVSSSDFDRVSKMLARAFMDDPLISHFMPQLARREAKLHRVFRLLLKLGLPHRSLHMTRGSESAAIWRPPNQWHLGLLDYIANGPELLSAFGGSALRVMGAMDFIEKKHPRTPHWYLQTLGTDPSKQGKGYGGRVVRHQLAIADRTRVPCYLESSKSTNVPVYQSLGFKLTGEIAIPNGPTIWPMWRDPAI